MGSYIILLVIFLYTISGIVFYIKGFDIICEQINDILNNKDFNNTNSSIDYKVDIKNEFKENSNDIFSSSKNNKITNTTKVNLTKTNLDIKLDSDINYNKNRINNI